MYTQGSSYQTGLFQREQSDNAGEQGRSALAVLISECMPQKLSAPSELLQKKQFFPPNTKGHIAFSHALLSDVKYGLSRYAVILSYWAGCTLPLPLDYPRQPVYRPPGEHTTFSPCCQKLSCPTKESRQRTTLR
jgi:hypothetical protein